MKTMTTAAFLAGITFTVSSFAQNPEASSKEMNSQHEAFKAYVNDALEAHKGKAPKELKGDHEAMKAYVGKALDAQRLADKKFLASLEGTTLKQTVENFIIGAGSTAYGSLFRLKAPLEKFECFKDFPDSDRDVDVTALQSCITSFYASISPNGYSWAYTDYDHLLNNDCTGNHWWNGENGTCTNDNWRHACVIVANAIYAHNWVINCEESGPTIDVQRK